MDAQKVQQLITLALTAPRDAYHSCTYVLQKSHHMWRTSQSPLSWISYQWDTQPSAFIVRDFLLAQERFNVIIDQSGIHGNFLDWMEWAVSNSHAIIRIAISQVQRKRELQEGGL